MTTPPLVSVGIPVFNGERYLKRALDSVLSQDYGRIEVIISDNASTDATREIALEYAARDPRVRVVASAQNFGAWWNFRRVLDLASGDYFSWAAHDDFRDANYISELAAALHANSGAALSCSRVVKVTAEGNVKSVHPFPEGHRARRVPAIIALMKAAQSAWIYGLFRTAAVRTALDSLPAAPSPWGLDHLLILRFLLGQAVVGTSGTTLHQAKTGVSASLYKPATIAASLRLQLLFLREAARIVTTSPLSLAEKLRLVPFVIAYVERNVFQFTARSIARAGLNAARLLLIVWRRLIPSGS